MTSRNRCYLDRNREGTAATRGLDQRVASGALDAMVKARR
jgi:hypothetical protein